MSNKIKDLYDGYKGELTALIISMNRGVTAKGAPYPGDGGRELLYGPRTG